MAHQGLTFHQRPKRDVSLFGMGHYPSWNPLESVINYLQPILDNNDFPSTGFERQSRLDPLSFSPCTPVDILTYHLAVQLTHRQSFYQAEEERGRDAEPHHFICWQNNYVEFSTAGSHSSSVSVPGGCAGNLSFTK